MPRSAETGKAPVSGQRRAVVKVRPGALHLRAHHVDESAVAGLHPCLAQDLTHRRFTGMLQPHRSRATTRARRSARPRMHGPCHNTPRSRLDSAQVRSVPIVSPRAHGVKDACARGCLRARAWMCVCVRARACARDRTRESALCMTTPPCARLSVCARAAAPSSPSRPLHSDPHDRTAHDTTRKRGAAAASPPLHSARPPARGKAEHTHVLSDA